MKNLKILFIIISILFLWVGNFAQKDGDQITIGEYKTLHSKILKEDRTLLIHLPGDYESQSKKKYPVFYMLYGNHTSTYFAQTVSILDTLGSGGNIPSMILVGITNTDRYRDLLPKTHQGKETGIENFIDFFKKELFPWVEENYRTKKYRMIMGPQAGANFVFYTAFKYPQMFNSIIGGNPFRWTGGRNFIINQAKEIIKKNKIFKKSLYFACNDNDSLEKQGNEYMKKFKTFVHNNNPKGFDFVVNYFKNWDEFLGPLDLRRGIKTIFKNYRFSLDNLKCKLSDIKDFYQKRSEEYGYTVDIPNQVLVRAYDNLFRTKVKAAKEILEFILKVNPYDPNGLWRKHMVLVGEGKIKEAVSLLEIMLSKSTSSDNGMLTGRIKSLKSKIN